jgi:hypothetical protein
VKLLFFFGVYLRRIIINIILSTIFSVSFTHQHASNRFCEKKAEKPQHGLPSLYHWHETQIFENRYLGLARLQRSQTDRPSQTDEECGNTYDSCSCRFGS